MQPRVYVRCPLRIIRHFSNCRQKSKNIFSGTLEETATFKTLDPEAWQIPKETALFANYPNPFNPETWIPYQLAEAGDVTVTIYDIHGRVVRGLDLGHQRAGMYHGRSRAAYWDGRNAQGEPCRKRSLFLYAYSRRIYRNA